VRTTEAELRDGRRQRRRHSAEFKAMVIAKCSVPSVSIAAVAMRLLGVRVQIIWPVFVHIKWHDRPVTGTDDEDLPRRLDDFDARAARARSPGPSSTSLRKRSPHRATYCGHNDAI